MKRCRNGGILFVEDWQREIGRREEDVLAGLSPCRGVYVTLVVWSIERIIIVVFAADGEQKYWRVCCWNRLSENISCFLLKELYRSSVRADAAAVWLPCSSCVDDPVVAFAYLGHLSHKCLEIQPGRSCGIEAPLL